jgi:hypothetical protein
VPATATRLFLGFVDGAYNCGPGYYHNNKGWLMAKVRISFCLPCRLFHGPLPNFIGILFATVLAYLIFISGWPPEPIWRRQPGPAS